MNKCPIGRPKEASDAFPEELTKEARLSIRRAIESGKEHDRWAHLEQMGLPNNPGTHKVLFRWYSVEILLDFYEKSIEGKH